MKYFLLIGISLLLSWRSAAESIQVITEDHAGSRLSWLDVSLYSIRIGEKVERVDTHDVGLFSFNIPPGAYKVEARSNITFPIIRSHVLVRSGQNKRIWLRPIFREPEPLYAIPPEDSSISRKMERSLANAPLFAGDRKTLLPVVMYFSKKKQPAVSIYYGEPVIVTWGVITLYAKEWSCRDLDKVCEGVGSAMVEDGWKSRKVHHFRVDFGARRAYLYGAKGDPQSVIELDP